VARKAADLVLNSFKEMNSPNEISVEFGVTFKATTTVIIAAASTDATFKVSLKWQKPKA
jgi:hypothetical protein